METGWLGNSFRPHTSHTHTHLAGVSRAYSRAQRARRVCSRVSLHRKGRTHQWEMAIGCPLGTKSWILITRKTRSKILLCFYQSLSGRSKLTSPGKCPQPSRLPKTPPTPPDSVSALAPFDIFLMVLMITVGDYLIVFFYVSFCSSTPTS